MPKAPKCANPLFLRWVQEMHDEKDYRKRGGPPRATGYENAIRSLQECTTKYDHPLDMKGKVSGVGPTTINRLVERLEEYCEKRRIPMPEVKPKQSRAKKAPVKPKAEPKAKPAPKSEAEKENENFATDSDAEVVVVKPTRKVKAAPKRNATKASDEGDDEKFAGDSDVEVAPAKSKRKSTRRVTAAKVVLAEGDDDDYDE